jgi:hypothetical protein
MAAVELYNMKNDPGERNDLAAREINQVNDLLDDLLGWLKETKAPMPSSRIPTMIRRSRSKPRKIKRTADFQDGGSPRRKLFPRSTLWTTGGLGRYRIRSVSEPEAAARTSSVSVAQDPKGYHSSIGNDFWQWVYAIARATGW